VRYFFLILREAGRAVLYRPGSFLGSILTVFLATLMAGSFALIIKNTSLALDKFKAEAAIEIYLKSDTDSLAMENLKDVLVANKYILNAKYISKETALYRLRETFGPEMVAGLKTNPLPESFEITLDPDVYEGNNFEVLVDSLSKFPEVDDVGYVPTVVSRLKILFRLFTALGLALGFLVALATGFIIGNTIHVKIVERRQTFYVMRLVGASAGFIRSPYLFLGSLIGFLGSGLSLLCLKLGQIYFSSFVHSIVFLSNIETICFIIAGGLIGFIGSHLALKRFLKI
jgi:cell division transport system permease protein